MSRSVGDLVRLSKQQLSELAGDGLVAQSGGLSIGDSFDLPQIGAAVYGALPSIETFVLSSDGTVSATGSNEALNQAWTPAINRLVDAVMGWVAEVGVTLVGDSYITASITAADQVNGEAHFDDDQFNPTAGAGLVAIVGDLGGSSVAADPITHEQIRPHQSLTASKEMKAEFANGGFGRVDYQPNQLVALPQFGQLHSGPGPCGSADEVRHLMVFRATTKPANP